MPTPWASGFNDVKDLDNWQARRDQIKAQGINGNGMGMPLGVAVRLLPTGKYADAVARWESLTRPAPEPTETGPRGGQRLAPEFVEWMMGLPAGWVTDPALGLTRNAQLKLLGNGVVPQQAQHAISELLADVSSVIA